MIVSRASSADEQDRILKLFSGVTPHTRAGRQFPHKFLLLLVALSRLKAGHQRLSGFTDYESALKPLLKQFNPLSKTQHCAYPFWWLQKDGVWEVFPNGAQPRLNRTDPSRAALVAQNAAGGFPESVFSALKKNRQLYDSVVAVVLAKHKAPEHATKLFEILDL